MKEQVYARFLTLSLPLSPSLSARLRSSKPFAPPPPHRPRQCLPWSPKGSRFASVLALRGWHT